MRSSDRDLQRAAGSCRLVLHGSARGTEIVDVFQRSPLRVLFPQVGGRAIEEAVLINSAGGIAGGDRLDLAITVGGTAAIALTTQAAEKVYRALDEPARISTKLTVGAAARLAWCPQETIVFNRARVDRRTHIAFSSGAELLALEWLVLGRAAYGETVTAGHITDSWRVEKDGRLIWADSFRVTDDIFPHLQRSALLSTCTALATIVYAGPDPDAQLAHLREASVGDARDAASSLECHVAATAIGGLIVVRMAASQSYSLGLAVRRVLRLFEHECGKGPFRVPRMWCCS
jgi:urease accessory protein